MGREDEYPHSDVSAASIRPEPLEIARLALMDELGVEITEKMAPERVDRLTRFIRATEQEAMLAARILVNSQVEGASPEVRDALRRIDDGLLGYIRALDISNGASTGVTAADS